MTSATVTSPAGLRVLSSKPLMIPFDTAQFTASIAQSDTSAISVKSAAVSTFSAFAMLEEHDGELLAGDLLIGAECFVLKAVHDLLGRRPSDRLGDVARLVNVSERQNVVDNRLPGNLPGMVTTAPRSAAASGSSSPEMLSKPA